MKKLATLLICASLTLGLTYNAHARSVQYGMAESHQITNPASDFGNKPTMEMFGKVMQAHRQHANNPDIFITNFKPETAVCTAYPLVKDNGLIATGWIVDYDLHINGEKQQWYAVFFNNELIVMQEDGYNKVHNNFAKIHAMQKAGVPLDSAISYYNDSTGTVWVTQSSAMTPEHFTAWRDSLPKD